VKAIALAGASGTIGVALGRALAERGWRVVPLVRGTPTASGAIHWDPMRAEIDARALEGFDAVVHLGGEPIANGRWTPERKRVIRDSRTRSTELLARTIAGLATPPGVFLCASAVGYYGDRGDVWVDESSAPGEGFLAEVCRAWEAAADPARAAGIRTVHLRIGLVLDGQGGALARMLPLFRLGLGGALGSGRQYMSWVSLPDVVRMLELALDRADLSGPVNAVSPQPVTNARFTRVLARVLGRPAFLSVPAFALRIAMGEMAQELLLHGQRVVPRRLQEAGFEYRHREIEEALRAVL
jgi:uncharacterized protein (TIGR01777 family)